MSISLSKIQYLAWIQPCSPELANTTTSLLCVDGGRFNPHSMNVSNWWTKVHAQTSKLVSLSLRQDEFTSYSLSSLLKGPSEIGIRSPRRASVICTLNCAGPTSVWRVQLRLIFGISMDPMASMQSVSQSSEILHQSFTSSDGDQAPIAGPL